MGKRVWQALLALVLLAPLGAWAWRRYLAPAPPVSRRPVEADAGQPLLAGSTALRQFQIPFEADCFYPSPLGDGGIWVANQEMVQAFDPVKGTFTDLAPRFEGFAKGMGNRVAADPIEPDRMWVGHPERGLFCYRKAQGKGDMAASHEQLGRGAVTALLPDQSHIWIGTSEGLHRLSREDWKVQAIPEVRGRVDELRLDTHLGLCFRSGQIWQAWREGQPPRDIPPLASAHDRVKAVLAKVRPDSPLDPKQIYQAEEDGDLIWFVGDLGLGRLDRKTQQISYIELFCEPIYRGQRGPAFLVDKQLLWVRWGNRLLALEKQPPADLLLSETDARARYQTRIGLYQQVREATDVVAMLRVASNRLQYDESTGKGPFPRPREDHWELFKQVEAWLRDHRTEIIEPLMALEKQEGDNPVSVTMRLYGLFCGYAMNGQPDAALQVYGTLDKEEAVSTVQRHILPEDLQVLRRSALELRRIEETVKAPDQRRWELSRAYGLLESASWNLKENRCHQPLVEENCQKLLKEHPKSPFAPRAWWGLHLEPWHGDGKHTQSSLQAFATAHREFLRRYPKSDLAPLARFRLACDIYSSVQHADARRDLKDLLPASKRRGWLLEAREHCQKALQAEKKGTEIRLGGVDFTPATLLVKLNARLAKTPPTKQR